MTIRDDSVGQELSPPAEGIGGPGAALTAPVRTDPNEEDQLPRGYPKGTTDPVCSIEGCERPHYGHGFCHMHYQRWKKHGDPLYTGGKFAPGEALAWLKDALAHRDRSGCWEWPFLADQHGYGRVTIEGKQRRLSAVVLELEGRERPKGKDEGLHSCDNPPCCNPTHLRWGTRQENVADAVARNRTTYGEKHHRALLTEEDVHRILADQRPQKNIAAEYGVARATIGSIKQGQSWRHSYLLRELVEQCASLNTQNVPLMCKAAAEVWSYARSVAGEIGMKFENPPIPGVCRKAGGNCSCGGRC